MAAAPTLLQWMSGHAHTPRSQYVYIPSRSFWLIDRPPLKSLCVAVVHLSEVTHAMEFFYFSLRSASQQAASNCYIFSWQE